MLVRKPKEGKGRKGREGREGKEGKRQNSWCLVEARSWAEEDASWVLYPHRPFQSRKRGTEPNQPSGLERPDEGLALPGWRAPWSERESRGAKPPVGFVRCLPYAWRGDHFATRLKSAGIILDQPLPYLWAGKEKTQWDGWVWGELARRSSLFACWARVKTGSIMGRVNRTMT